MHSIWVNLQQAELSNSDPQPSHEVNHLDDINAAVTAIEKSLAS
jgi:hypothetical protein